MLIQSSVSPASGWNLYETKNEKEREREKEKEREKERETTNSIIPSKQSKKKRWNPLILLEYSTSLVSLKRCKTCKTSQYGSLWCKIQFWLTVIFVKDAVFSMASYQTISNDSDLFDTMPFKMNKSLLWKYFSKEAFARIDQIDSTKHILL